MSYFFSNLLSTKLAVNQTLLEGREIKLALFRYAPSMGSPDPTWLAARTVAELKATHPGWIEVQSIPVYPLVEKIFVSTTLTPDGKSRYLGYTDYRFKDLTAPAEVRAIAVVLHDPAGTLMGVVDPLLFVTTTPLGNGTNIYPDDRLTSNPDTNFPTEFRWLLGWSVMVVAGSVATSAALTGISSPAVGSVYLVTADNHWWSFKGPTPNDNISKWSDTGVAALHLLEGPLVISRGSPAFEVSGSQHVWLYPQRANMIANPSFEAVGTAFWGSNGPIARVAGGAPATALVIKGEKATASLLPITGVEGENWMVPKLLPDGSTVGEVWSWSDFTQQFTAEWVNHGPVSGASAWAGKATAPAHGYLTPTVGTATTPDPGPLPNDCTFVLKVRASGTTDQAIASQMNVVGQYSWNIRRAATDLIEGIYPLGTSTNAESRFIHAQAVTGADEFLAIAIRHNNGASRNVLTTYRSTDGAAWAQLATSDTGGTLVPFDSTDLVRIGEVIGNQLTWQGRIYSVELRTGLDPAAGTVLWRFDADEYPGTGTSYVDPRGRTWTLTTAAAITAKTGPSPGYTIMESNIFPTKMGDLTSEQWTLQLMAKGVGDLKVGLVYWDAEYESTGVDWGEETYTLSAGSWFHIAVNRTAPEAHLAMLRLEFNGVDLTIDRVLAERGYLKEWLYFDGDEKYGARDDFSWYGGYGRRGASYSFWYNHRRAVVGRLFASTVNPNDPSANVTDEDMEEQGLVYRWVPAGITVIPHMDVLYPFDLQNPIPAKPTTVLPYQSVSTPDGVPSPW